MTRPLGPSPVLPGEAGDRPGFFIPYRHAAAVRPAGYPATEPLFRAAVPGIRDLIGSIAAHLPAILALRGPAPEPRLDQDWFAGLDAAAAYALVRARAPSRIVEVGSGHSTRFLARAVRDGGLATRLTAIDPAPRAPLPPGVTHVPALLGDADPALFAALGPGDVLVIDGSHLALPGTDADRLLLDTLPRLPAGVLVHVHDVLLPDPYPEAWAWRGYNEQGLVAALLLGGMLRVLWSSRYARTRLAGDLAAAGLDALPLVPGAIETSLWAEKVSAAVG